MNDLDALRERLAEIPAAVYIPDTGRVHCCPRRAGVVHECPSSFTLPPAEQFAAYVSEISDCEAVVLVYGVVWNIP